MTLPKLIILDRDGTLNYASSNSESPLYYVTKLEHVVIKPGVQEAIDLIKAHGIAIIVATRQRCISKGLAAREQVNLINARVIRLLDIDNAGVFVEERENDKGRLLKEIIDYYGKAYTGRVVKPGDMVLFDDSPREIKVAQELGIAAYDGSDLLASVKQVLHIS